MRSFRTDSLPVARVGYLVTSFPKLSETFVAREIVLLRQSGMQVRVCACHNAANGAKHLLPDDIRTLCDDVQYLDRGPSVLSAIGHPGLFLRALRMAKEIAGKMQNPPDDKALAARAVHFSRWVHHSGIHHVHAHWPYATMVAFVASKLLDFSLSISVHAHEVAHENGHFPEVLPHVKFAAFCNDAARRYLLTRVGEQYRDKSHLIYHGVDIDTFAFVPPPSPEQGLRLVSAGRLTPTKGFDRLVRLCAKAREAGLNVSLTILGEGGEEQHIRQVAEQTGMDRYLSMPGWVRHHEMQEHLRNAHGLALMADTGYHDGLPNVVLEAMSCGRPAIVSNLPAAKEAIRHGQNGFILEGTEDADGFVSALQTLRKKDVLHSFATAARKTIESQYADRLHITKMADLFMKSTTREEVS